MHQALLVRRSRLIALVCADGKPLQPPKTTTLRGPPPLCAAMEVHTCLLAYRGSSWAAMLAGEETISKGEWLRSSISPLLLIQAGLPSFRGPQTSNISVAILAQTSVHQKLPDCRSWL